MKEEQITIHDAYKCLKYVRVAPGKVYEYELAKELEGENSTKAYTNIVESINNIFDLEFAKCDVVESSYSGQGLSVIYTNPEYRLLLDILLSEALKDEYPLDRTVYMDSVEETVDGDKVVVNYYYHQVKKTLDELLQKHKNHYYVSKAIDYLQQWPKTAELEIVDGDNILSYYDGETLDISGKCIMNLDTESLQKRTGAPVVIKNLNAEGAYFKGKRISFDNCTFIGGANFKGCIFKGEALSFQNVTFKIDDTTEPLGNEITFRNSRMFIRNIMFDNAVVEGNHENKIISFEDAVLDASYISFLKMQFGDAKLFCYQTLMKNAEVDFIEPEMENASLDFEDSVVDSVIMLNIDCIPETQFSFRECEKLVIENCNISDNIIVNHMKMLSLRACRNQGKILTEWVGKVKDTKSGKKNYPILLSILNNSDSNEIKAEQFILLKENFASIGQYDYEDEAFIQYMNHRSTNNAVRFAYTILREIGKYGISPARVLVTMVYSLLIFGVIYFALGIFDSTAFSYSFSEVGLVKHLTNSFYLSISNLISYDSSVRPANFPAVVISMLESIWGWFLLGYLSVAIVRKTLR